VTALAIEARGLTKRFDGAEVVRGIDLEIETGRCFGLLGPNGAGKTTTIRMILGQSPANGGTLTVFGRPMPQSVRSVRRRMGVVPQTDNLDPDFTVGENLSVYAGYFGIPGADLKQRLPGLLEFVALSDREHAPISQLSGGMKRRLTIARSLVNEPELLVLDEPTTGLDPQVRHLIWARLRALKESGKTLLLTTHYMEEAERLCDRLAIMDRGRVLALGSPRELIGAHVEPEVFELRGAHGRIDSLLGGAPGVRVEASGDVVYAYARDAGAVLRRLENAAELSFLHRPANLEDVFLKITGHELRD
jgi:lipooligosaccharide transport system ATP-binding protein